jgi:PhoH-like ATPase
MDAQKCVVIDTNVLLIDPQVVYSFENTVLVIPGTVLDELDKFKGESTVRGMNARESSRVLEAIVDKVGEDCSVGIHIGKNSILRIVVVEDSWLEALPASYQHVNSDNLILATFTHLRALYSECLLLSNDRNFRLRAKSIGIEVSAYEFEEVDLASLYSGVRKILVPGDYVNQLHSDGTLSLNLLNQYGLNINESIVLVEEGTPKHSALGRVHHSGLVRKIEDLPPILRITPRNTEQRIAMSLLMDPDISLVTMVGKAGTGKTLLPLATGIHQAHDMKLYSKVHISRPVIPMGKDIGFLPGRVEQKMEPWLKGYHDNLSVIFGGKNYKDYMDRFLEIEPLTYIRGRSMPKVFMIIDEAQNLTPNEVKTILTRAGEGSKFVLIGDIEQIDNPYLSERTNGLVHVIERLRGESIVGHTTLTKVERSALAELAANKL